MLKDIFSKWLAEHPEEAKGKLQKKTGCLAENNLFITEDALAEKHLFTEDGRGQLHKPKDCPDQGVNLFVTGDGRGELHKPKVGSDGTHLYVTEDGKGC